jgi:hypothetical protein
MKRGNGATREDCKTRQQHNSRSERHNEVSKLRGHFYGTMVDTPLEFQQMFRYLITPIVLDALRSATYPSRS